MKVLKVLAQLHRFANIFSVDPLKEIARSRTLYYLPATEVFPLSLPQEHIETLTRLLQAGYRVYLLRSITRKEYAPLPCCDCYRLVLLPHQANQQPRLWCWKEMFLSPDRIARLIPY